MKQNFDWFKKNEGIVYFDSAATTLKPKVVLKAINDFYNIYGTNTHNTDSNKAFLTEQVIVESRKKIATLFNCNFKNIIFNSGATEGLSTIINGLKPFLRKDDEIILNRAEHGSNLVGWIEASNNQENFKIVYIDDHKINEQEILRNINKNTKIISFANATNLLGSSLDYQVITKKAKEINPNIIIVIDATQFLPHCKMDVKNNEVDFVVCSAHKMLGPTGVGCIYINDKWINKIKPLRYGGGMNNKLDDNSYTLSFGYDRFEGGTQNLSGIYGWAKAIDFIDNFGWKNISKKEHELRSYAIKKLNENKNIVIYNKDSKLPIIIFNYKGIFAQDFANYLGFKNIIVRSGLSCAKLASKIINCEAVVRISFYLYNDKKDIDILIKAINDFKKGDDINQLI